MPGHVTVVHAGREEFRFCHRAIGQRPANWFDTQIASGLVGLDYPAAYGTLIHKLLGKSLGKGETRTNWRRRPLSKRQTGLCAAGRDVPGAAVREIIAATGVPAAHAAGWRTSWRLAGASWRWRIDGAMASRLGHFGAVASAAGHPVYEIWKWRDQQARHRDVPPRRVLRDDLMVELARRGSDEPQHIRAVRGMDWRKQRQAVPEICRDALPGPWRLPDEDCPPVRTKSARPQFTLLGQFLATAVNSMARSAQVAPGLIGSVQDVRDSDRAPHGIPEPRGSGAGPGLARGGRGPSDRPIARRPAGHSDHGSQFQPAVVL